MRTFIHEKYTMKKFASGTWPPQMHKPATVDPSSSQSNNEPAAKASSLNLQIGPKKVADHFKPNDLLKFEDEAFAFPVRKSESRDLAQAFWCRAVQIVVPRWMALGQLKWQRWWLKRLQGLQAIDHS